MNQRALMENETIFIYKVILQPGFELFVPVLDPNILEDSRYSTLFPNLSWGRKRMIRNLLKNAINRGNFKLIEETVVKEELILA